MAAGDVHAVEGRTDLHYVDTGMYGTAGYGAVYLLDAERPALVDTGIGTDHDRVLAAMDEVGIDRGDLAALVLTHVHLDHAGGAGVLADACPNADVYVHRIGAPHVADPERLVAGTRAAVGDQWRFYTEPEPVPEGRIVELEDGDGVDLGDRTLVARHAPGHAPHQLVFHDERADAVFTGDAAGIWIPALSRVVETSPPPNFDLEGCLADVETIRGLDPERLLFTHFGPGPGEPEPLLDSYRATLRAWVASVDAVADELGADAAPDYFADRTDLDRVWGATKAHGEVAMNVRGVLRALDRELDAE